MKSIQQLHSTARISSKLYFVEGNQVLLIKFVSAMVQCGIIIRLIKSSIIILKKKLLIFRNGSQLSTHCAV